MRCRAECTGGTANSRWRQGPFHLQANGTAQRGVADYYWADNEIDLLDMIETHRQFLLKGESPLLDHVVTIVFEDGRKMGEIVLAEFTPPNSDEEVASNG